MKSILHPPVREALANAEKQVGEAVRGSLAWYYLALAAIHLLGEIADAIRLVAAELPSNK